MNNKRKSLFNISVVILFTIIFHYIGWLNPVENFFRLLLKPSSQALYEISIKIGDENVAFENVDNLKQAYLDLNEKILKYQITDADNKILKEENKELRALLNFKNKNNYTIIGAEVIGKNIDPLGSTIILDKGLVDGLETNYAVIVNDGVLVGKIVKVDDHSSVVRLINDNQSKIAATIINNDRSIGLVEGGYGISVRLNYIPQNETVNISETVITSGLEENIPKGLLIGTIETIEKEAYHPFQKAILKPLADLDKLTMVSIIKYLK